MNNILNADIWKKWAYKQKWIKRFFLPKKNRQVFFIKDWFKFKSTSMWDVFPNEIDFWDGGKNNNLAGDLPF
jgi:hypothetical protein